MPTRGSVTGKTPFNPFNWGGGIIKGLLNSFTDIRGTSNRLAAACVLQLKFLKNIGGDRILNKHIYVAVKRRTCMHFWAFGVTFLNSNEVWVKA